jgi:sporulation integral membrane protein YlbJ
VTRHSISTHSRHSKPVTITLAAASALLVLFIIMYPEQAFRSSLSGLDIWWKIVFPALLPCFIACEIMAGFGVMHGIGVWFEPIMRMLFRLPGVSGWALSMGLAFGYPAGADTVARLHRDEQFEQDEAERLLALSHLASPVFMIAIIGVGFMGSAKFGIYLAAIHYMSALLMGLILTWWRPRHLPPGSLFIKRRRPSGWIGRRGLDAMLAARERDGRTFGRLLGDAVTISVQKLFVVGGYMMMFSVLIEVMSLSGLTQAGSFIVQSALSWLPNASEIAGIGASPLMEIHLGAYSISRNGMLEPVWAAALVSAALAWSGLSTHAQAQSLVRSCGLSYRYFLKARLLHAAIAFVAAFIFWNPFLYRFSHALAGFQQQSAQLEIGAAPFVEWSSAHEWVIMLVTLAAIVLLLLCSSLLAMLLSKLRVFPIDRS